MKSSCVPITLSLMFLVSATRLPAQGQALQFEAASVKPSTSGFNGVRGGCHGIDSAQRQDGPIVPLGRCVITDGRLSHFIATAWKVPQIGFIQGAPDWVISGSERFNIEAKADNPATTTEAQLLTMLQNLLIERFQLKFHREEKQVAGFALVVGKDGSKFKESTAEDGSFSFGDAFKPAPGRPITMIARKQSMATLANLLSQVGQMGQIADETRLTGLYDFRLAWDESAGPSLSTALQEQMGLRLNKSQVRVSYFMFESAQRPSGN